MFPTFKSANYKRVVEWRKSPPLFFSLTPATLWKRTNIECNSEIHATFWCSHQDIFGPQDAIMTHNGKPSICIHQLFSHIHTPVASMGIIMNMKQLLPAGPALFCSCWITICFNMTLSWAKWITKNTSSEICMPLTSNFLICIFLLFILSFFYLFQIESTSWSF